MGDVIQISKAEREILETERKLRAITIALEEIERDLAHLDLLESTLNQNIWWLKKSTTISVAAEYKKAKEDLIKVRNRKAFLATDYRNHIYAKTKTENALKQMQEVYLELTKIPQNNVIQVDFEKKHD
jgi:hypothetical protein